MNRKRPFYGRENELHILQNTLKKRTSSLVVIRGRRRIGKSRLIEEFSKELNTLYFIGLPPTEKSTNKSQREEFARQMSFSLKAPLIQSQDWSELFWYLGRETSKGQWVVVLDEISWMGSKDPDFLGKLKNAWDMSFSKNPKLMLILCGSVSSWIEKNILSHTGFLGRVSIDLILEELPLKDCVQFWGKTKSRVASYEVFKVLGVTGGIPKYLEEIIPEKNAEDNIKSLCFQPQGLLFREFDQIFSDLFSQRNEIYKKIVSYLADGSKNMDEISQYIGFSKGGIISNYLLDLEEAGFVKADWTWNIENEKISNLRSYRLSDNYVRFYLKYILPQQELIRTKTFAATSLTALPNWTTIMGYQFENLVIANRNALYLLLKINPADVHIANPFFQRKTQRKKGCQIDFMIQTHFRTLYVVEIKFSRSKIGSSVVAEMEEKLKRLTLPKNISVRCALVHVNGVTEAVQESGLFDFIVDFSELLT